MYQHPERKIEPIHLSASDIQDLPSDSFPDPSTGGDVTWKTLFSASATPTNTFTTGIATCKADAETGCGGHLKSHRHTHAELYHVISGEGAVTIEGVEHHMRQGSVVFIPGNAEHGVRCTGSEDLVWLYVFAADDFGEVTYRFDEPGSGVGEDGRMDSKSTS